MTSNNVSIAQRAPIVQSRLKTLINNDLKSICRAYHLAISGTKAQLQKRVIELLDGAVATQNYARFDDLAVRANHHGELPATPMNTSNNHRPPPSYTVYQSAERGLRVSFHKNPFYEKVQTIVRPQDLPAMPQNRHTVKCDVVLNEEQALRVTNSPSQYRIMLYCAQTDSHNPPMLNVSFPPQIEVKLNDDDVKSNYKGLKNKPGSTKPADLTRMIRPRANYSNKLSICYALTQRRFVFTVILVRYNDAEALVQRVRAGSVFSKDQVLADMRRLNADPDIAATSSKMSLKDPISTLRITTPVRSTFCSHGQCFDASFYMQLQEQAPTWSCPICSKPISFDSLAIDKYVEEILSTTAKTIEQVTIEPDGKWRVVKEDEEKGMSNTAKGAPRASYDDDFDDDLVEIDDPDEVIVKKESTSQNMFSTPPLSSREASVQTSAAKRPAVIDLTLSDDEDEPARPTKRANTSSEVHRPFSLLPTPISVNGRPHSAQPPFLDGASFQSSFSQPLYSSSTAPSAGLGRPPDLIRRSSHSGPVTWGGIRSPSASYMPQMGGFNSQRGSASNSPSIWPPALPPLPQQWPRDGGVGWPARSPPDQSRDVRLPALPSLTRHASSSAVPDRAPVGNSPDSFPGDVPQG